MEISCRPVQGTFLICSHTCTFVWNPEHLNKTGAVASLSSIHSILSQSHCFPGIFSFKFDIGLGSCCAASEFYKNDSVKKKHNTARRCQKRIHHAPFLCLRSPALSCRRTHGYMCMILRTYVCLLGSLGSFLSRRALAALMSIVDYLSL